MTDVSDSIQTSRENLSPKTRSVKTYALILCLFYAVPLLVIFGTSLPAWTPLWIRLLVVATVPVGMLAIFATFLVRRLRLNRRHGKPVKPDVIESLQSPLLITIAYLLSLSAFFVGTLTISFTISNNGLGDVQTIAATAVQHGGDGTDQHNRVTYVVGGNSYTITTNDSVQVGDDVAYNPSHPSRAEMYSDWNDEDNPGGTVAILFFLGFGFGIIAVVGLYAHVKNRHNKDRLQRNRITSIKMHYGRAHYWVVRFEDKKRARYGDTPSARRAIRAQLTGEAAQALKPRDADLLNTDA
ncbi:hypothetical protein [Rudaeicoccus suwonensis]|uniref:Uncharacterized protein n=1 Tax=Rudaeicoccus suwonensis TaxID=657409 RepID=A0A561DWU1_9MICO|nr:hypothetical protein [Rudaeicoccus suwonensis]TWE07845.1 hypothetical protein BKA23_3212 [Rudaeicoccus suwonensis]